MGTDVDRYAHEARDRERARLEQNGKRLDTLPAFHRLALVRASAPRSEVRLVEYMLSTGRETHALKRMDRLERQLGSRA